MAKKPVQPETAPAAVNAINAGCPQRVLEILAAEEPDRDALAHVLVSAGYAAGVADLFISITRAERRLRPAEAEKPEVQAERDRVARHLDGLAGWRPTTADEAVSRADRLEEGRLELAALDRRLSEINEAERQLRWIYSYARFLFPQLEPAAVDRVASNGCAPPEVDQWLIDHDASPWHYGSWKRIGFVRPPRPRAVLRAAEAPVNRAPMP